MQEIQNKVIQWAEDKGIFEKSDPTSQFLKTISEVGELADAVNKNDLPEIKDAIGDISVTLILHAKMTGVDIVFHDGVYVALNVKIAVLHLVENICQAQKSEYDDSIYLLNGIAAYYNWTLQECLQSAYDVISKRTGKMKNGVFVKDKVQELNTTLEYNSAQMCKKCAYKDANDNLKALYCNSCFRNYVDNFEELDNE